MKNINAFLILPSDDCAFHLCYESFSVLECSPVVPETGVPATPSHIKVLKNRYLILPCLTLKRISNRSRVS